MPPTKLLERMRHSPAGWKQRDLRRLLVGYGFELTEGANHTLYRHPCGLRITVPRHNTLAIVYPLTAVRMIDRLLALEAEGSK